MLYLGSIRGTTIHVDLSFFILIVFFVAANYSPSLGIHYALLWIPVVFISVLIHELAHAAAIGLFGHGASRIVLGGMGGVTINDRRARPWHDMVISLAGPISSFVIAFLMWLLMRRVPLVSTDPMLIEFVPRMLWANVFWGIFNLIPTTPLDGGHAVRNFFRMFLSESQAFVIAVWIGMIGGAAAALVAGFVFRQIFIAAFLAWFVFVNYQHWQEFRRQGYPGD
jgi:Zn-dependent protease